MPRIPQVGADETAADSKQAVEKSLALAEQNAEAVRKLASVASAEQQQKLRSWLYAEGVKWDDQYHMDIVIDLLNKGGTVAENVISTCDVIDKEGKTITNEHYANELNAVSPGQHRNMYIYNAARRLKDDQSHYECSVIYDDEFKQARSLHFVCAHNPTEDAFRLFLVVNP